MLFSQIIKLSVETKTPFPPEERRLDEYQWYQWTITTVRPRLFDIAHKHVHSRMVPAHSLNCVRATQLFSCGLESEGPLVLLWDIWYNDNCTTPIGKETRNFLDNKRGLFWVLEGQDALHLTAKHLEGWCSPVLMWQRASELKLLPNLKVICNSWMSVQFL